MRGGRCILVGAQCLQMQIYVKHIALPALAPTFMIGLYYTPVTVFGCFNRGLMALAVALVSAILAFVAIGFGFSAQRRRDPISRWWIISALMYTLPLALLLGPLR